MRPWAIPASAGRGGCCPFPQPCRFVGRRGSVAARVLSGHVAAGDSQDSSRVVAVDGEGEVQELWDWSAVVVQGEAIHPLRQWHDNLAQQPIGVAGQISQEAIVDID